MSVRPETCMQEECSMRIFCAGCMGRRRKVHRRHEAKLFTACWLSIFQNTTLHFDVYPALREVWETADNRSYYVSISPGHPAARSLRVWCSPRLSAKETWHFRTNLIRQEIWFADSAHGIPFTGAKVGVIATGRSSPKASSSAS